MSYATSQRIIRHIIALYNISVCYTTHQCVIKCISELRNKSANYTTHHCVIQHISVLQNTSVCYKTHQCAILALYNAQAADCSSYYHILNSCVGSYTDQRRHSCSRWHQTVCVCARASLFLDTMLVRSCVSLLHYTVCHCLHVTVS